MKIIYAEENIFTNEEYKLFEKYCKNNKILLKKESINKLFELSKNNQIKYLWGSVNSHNILNIEEFINFPSYTERFPKQYINSTFFLNENSEYKFIFQLEKFDGEKFIKPYHGDKLFSGGLYSYEDILEMNLRPYTYIVLNEPKELGKEVRFIIHNGKIISGATYIKENRNKVLPFEYSENSSPKEELELIQDFISNNCQNYISNVDKTITMDITFFKNKDFKIVEFNSFWAAGLYGNDPSEILKTIIES